MRCLGFVLAVGSFVFGLILRWLYIFEWHVASRYLFSDMEGYFNAAQDFCNPNFTAGIGETVHPPGTRFFFGILMWADDSFTLVMIVQFILAALVPLLLWGIARNLFGRRTALWTLAISSLYYPLFDYFGYVLSEGPFMFSMVCSFWFLVRGLRTRGRLSLMLWFAAGGMLGVAASFKSVVLPAAFLVMLALLLIMRKHKLVAGRGLITAAAGLLMILAPLSVRATILSEGRFCLIANDATRNILLGHYGDIGGARFSDPLRGTVYFFGSPSCAQKGFSEVVDFQFGVYENEKIMAEAMKWITAHPLDSVLLSFEHLFDLFYGTLAWPSCVSETRKWVVLFSEIYLVLILFPACYFVLRHLRPMLSLRADLCGDVLVLMPIVALAIAAFLTLGEPRYRIPFDGFMILLACRAFCGNPMAEANLFAVPQADALNEPVRDPAPARDR